MAAAREAGCLLFLGLGGGFPIAAALEDPRVCSVLVIEQSAETLRALLQQIPLASILSDPRVRLLVGIEGIRTAVLAAWQPALMGGLRTVPLVPWCAARRGFFDAALRETQAAVDAVRSDYGVQAHFGKRWFSNMIKNMQAAERQAMDFPRTGSACVTAAGPSLEAQMHELAAARREGILIASDTSLPCLLQSGITPDVVLSIDCQNHGYHHFFKGIPARTSLFLDIASPPFLARITPRTFFLASGHPFAAYLSTRWMGIPRIDMTGGNVTHAAVALARGLGAHVITLFGADFSYPRGKSYSRGTYLYDFFDARQDRLSPTESSFFGFIFRASDTGAEECATGVRYTTPVLRGYRDRLIEMMGRLDAQCIPVPGEGLSLDHGRAAPRDEPPLRWSPPVCGWREFLTAYAHDLAELPLIEGQPWAAVGTLSPGQRELWGTLLPVAARVEMEIAGSEGSLPALETARKWALARIARVLGERQRSEAVRFRL
jgi:hypothetical protein